MSSAHGGGPRGAVTDDLAQLRSELHGLGAARGDEGDGRRESGRTRTTGRPRSTTMLRRIRGVCRRPSSTSSTLIPVMIGVFLAVILAKALVSRGSGGDARGDDDRDPLFQPL